MLEVGHGVVTDLADEGVLVDGTLLEKFFRQAVYIVRINIITIVMYYNTLNAVQTTT
jgi:hypothetical protein